LLLQLDFWRKEIYFTYTNVQKRKHKYELVVKYLYLICEFTIEIFKKVDDFAFGIYTLLINSQFVYAFCPIFQKDVDFACIKWFNVIA
jgi:hypothetical protein